MTCERWGIAATYVSNFSKVNLGLSSLPLHACIIQIYGYGINKDIAPCFPVPPRGFSLEFMVEMKLYFDETMELSLSLLAWSDVDANAFSSITYDLKWWQLLCKYCNSRFFGYHFALLWLLAFNFRQGMDSIHGPHVWILDCNAVRFIYRLSWGEFIFLVWFWMHPDFLTSKASLHPHHAYINNAGQGMC